MKKTYIVPIVKEITVRFENHLCSASNPQMNDDQYASSEVDQEGGGDGLGKEDGFEWDW